MPNATHPTRDVLLSPSPTAVVWSGAGHPLVQIATPGVSLGAGDLLVEVELATVCGSDLHTVLGHRSADTPLVLGHEQVGRVVALGEHARASNGTPLMVGMRVIWSVAVACGDCDRCVRGLSQKCRTLAKYGHDRVRRGWELSGGFATHVQVLAGTAVIIVDDELPAAVIAPASCATATVVAALDAASGVVPLAGETVVIAGAGLLGLTACAMATDAGATVIVSDPDAMRREVALRFGAAAAVEPVALQPTLARMLEQGSREPLVAIEMSGAPSAVAALVSTVGVGGVVVLVGSVSPGELVPIDPESIVRRLVTLRGVHNYGGGQLERAAEYLEGAAGRYPFASLVGETFGLGEVEQALELAARGTHLRVAIDPRSQTRTPALQAVAHASP
ncbi:putative phosphonate catabolism associated alcohol dehydrogenase [Homoserinimonas aerilata]|uniref:alcohol dehydrogenase n=1 Tax=Homoserinimonas aerilata TaxID=1162970 RepID=A0A542YFD1_9MICO|nr:zinc-binding dehydrogenase [Homoserinimonas aerilata]TQL46782.1 putative phosphonate catabolism associated alcohol dehydrogenase [Homoserinimonas aerilata]